MTAVSSTSPIPVSYFLRVPNVGDRVNSDVVCHVSGMDVRHNKDETKPHLLAIGSIMAGSTAQSRVWGTGVMHPDIGIGKVIAGNVYALRGQLSRQTLRESGIKIADVPLGDPGFLAPRILGIVARNSPRYRLGIASHYVDRWHPMIRDYLAQEGVCDLNVHNKPRDFLDRMADCEVVLSSSLHGLIFAEAMGIPNLWIRASNEIAGGDFKFRDWFSTIRRPQHEVHQLDSTDDVFDLARRAETRESSIDTDALMTAFPKGENWAEDHTKLWTGHNWRSVERCRESSLPVFLISFNRGQMLRQVVDGLTRLSGRVDIIVHDNGSTDPSTLKTLLELESRGVTVYRYPSIASANDLNQVAISVARYFRDWAEPSRYVVSDCDVDLSIANPSVLDVYDELLNIFPKIECVGPMLRIRDIPKNYALRNRALNRQIEQFWRYEPTIINSSKGSIAVLSSIIDTTFALHRAGEPFSRLKSGLRVYEPFEALHLDWYGADDETYANTSSPAISHWNNISETTQHEADFLEHSHFFAVRQKMESGIEVYVEHLEDYAHQTFSPILQQGFDVASPEVRQGYIARTEQFRLNRESDVTRWAQASAHQSGWADRAHCLVTMIRPGESVFEFGAGASVVGKILPPGTTYMASDVAPLLPNVIQYNLNAEFLTPILAYDVGFFSGVLEYVHDMERLCPFLFNNFPTVVCSYAVATDNTGEAISRRRYSGWFSDYTESGLIQLFVTAGFKLSQSGDWGGQRVYRFDRSQNEMLRHGLGSFDRKSHSWLKRLKLWCPTNNARSDDQT